MLQHVCSVRDTFYCMQLEWLDTHTLYTVGHFSVTSHAWKCVRDTSHCMRREMLDMYTKACSTVRHAHTTHMLSSWLADIHSKHHFPSCESHAFSTMRIQNVLEYSRIFQVFVMCSTWYFAKSCKVIHFIHVSQVWFDNITK